MESIHATTTVVQGGYCERLPIIVVSVCRKFSVRVLSCRPGWYHSNGKLSLEASRAKKSRYEKV